MVELLLALLAFPIIWPFIAKKIWHRDISWSEVGLNILGIVILVTLTIAAGRHGQTADREVWNGEIVSKKRDHDSYVESYSCNCTSYSCGTAKSPRTCTRCQTCYRTHYTVEWYATANFGGERLRRIRLDYLDRLSRSVYNSPDPLIYKNCEPGQHASLENTYTNYVKAVPESLFNTVVKGQAYQDKIPEYPRVYGIYRFDRVINVDSSVEPNVVAELNNRLNETLKTLGPEKQVNVIVILTEIDDPSYRHVVENAWVGGKKNDVVVFIGLDGMEVTWADVMTFALNKGNELFHVTLRDTLLEEQTLSVEHVVDAVDSNIYNLYDRVQMADFEYLKGEIRPPDWVIIFAAILAVGGSIGLSFVMRNVRIGH